MADFYRVQGTKDLYDAKTNQRITNPALIGTTYSKDLGYKLPTGANPTDYKITGQVGATGTPGSALLGVPKVVKSTALTGDASGKLAQLKSQNAQLPQIPTFDENTFNTQLTDFISRYRASQTTPELQTAITDRTTARTNLANLKSSYQQGMNIVEDKVMPMEFITGQQASMQRQYNAQEANAIELYNIADQNLKAIQDQIQSGQANEMEIFKLQQAAQDSILKQKQYVYEQSQSLQDNQKNALSGIIEMMSGYNPDKLSAVQTNELANLAKSAGLPFNLVVAGLKAKYLETQSAAQQVAFDQGLKTRAMTLDEEAANRKLYETSGGGTITSSGSMPVDKSTQTAQSIVEIASELLNSPALGRSVGPISSKIPTITGESADFQAKYNSLKSLLTLDNLGLLKGVLSDSDMKILQQAATALDIGMSEKGFKAELNKLITKAQSALTNNSEWSW